MRREIFEGEKPFWSLRWFWVVIFLSLLGLAASIHLSVVHWNVHNIPGHISSCAINQKMNCDTVALSRYSSLSGVPISIWSALFFILMLTLSTWGGTKKSQQWPWPLLGLLNIFSVAISTPLFLISELIIQSFCVYCVFIYFMNLLVGLFWILGLRLEGASKTDSISFWLLGPNAGFAAFLLMFPTVAANSIIFWASWLVVLIGWIVALVLGSIRSWPNIMIGALKDIAVLFDRPLKGISLASLAVASLVAVLWLIPKMYTDHNQVIAGGTKNISFGKTIEGHNWIGASEPEVVVIEYSDYECPFCRKAHEVVRQVVRERKNWLRLVHVHVPLDHSCNEMLQKPFHLHACDCAKAAICADRQGRFWEMNDALFVRRCGLDPGGLAMLAQKLGMDLEQFRNCINAKETQKLLRAGIQECRQVAKECMKMGRSFGTPMFNISGEVVLGYKPKPFWVKKLESVRQARIKKPR